MFGNMFRGMIYGKGNRPDFSPEDLPDNRWALFFQMLKIRWGKLVGLNFLYLLFLFPMILWGWMNLEALNYVASQVLEGAATAADLVWTGIFWLGVNIPLSLLSGLALPGVTLVCRNWARDQNAWVWSDFKDAVKGNWKQAMATSALTSTLVFLLAVAFFLYPQIVPSELLSLFLRTLVVIMLAVVLLMQVFIWPMMVTYQNKWRNLVRNTLMITMARLPFALLVGIGLMLPVLAWMFIASGIVALIVALFYLVIGFSLSSFICCSYANAVFDRFINPHIAGAPVNQGLRPKEIDPSDDLDADIWNQFDKSKKPGEEP